ncbi:MAG: site-2 protease family protein [Candidatus Nealsonbacteria bacterium]
MSLIIFSLIVLLFSVIMHEVAHGSMALHLGDSTAKYAGRLTLNPLKHIDLFGTIILPCLLVLMRSPFVIGWAKPVLVNPYNFRDQKWGALKVSIAGPAANFALAAIFVLLIRLIPLPSTLILFFSVIVFYNLLLGLFNLVPIPPLDGSHVLFSFLPDRLNRFKLFLHQYGLFILMFFWLLGGLNFIINGVRLLTFILVSVRF